MFGVLHDAYCGCSADPFAALEGLDQPSTAAQAQQAPTGPGMDIDALYAAPAAPAQQQQQSSFLGGLDTLSAPAAPPSNLMGDPFAEPMQSTGVSGMSMSGWLLPIPHCDGVRKHLHVGCKLDCCLKLGDQVSRVHSSGKHVISGRICVGVDLSAYRPTEQHASVPCRVSRSGWSWSRHAGRRSGACKHSQRSRIGHCSCANGCKGECGC